MVDIPRFEAHPVDLPDATEMPPPADAGERLHGAEIRFRGELRGPESVAFDSRGCGPYTGVVDGRVLVFFPSTTQGEFGRHQIMEMMGLPARDLRMLDPLLSYPSTILGRDRTVILGRVLIQGHRHRRRGLTRLVWSFWTDDKAGVSA
ncbi:protein STRICTOSIDINE SYNTHASE-LIKE 3-like [Hordeum vulgare]|nr:protein STRICTOSIDINE SYNTHASE-LIKE 3-like [Hordeum vulgare]